MEKKFTVNGKEVKISDCKVSEDSVSFTLDSKRYHYRIAGRDGGGMVLDRGELFSAFVSSANKESESMIIARGLEAIISTGNGQKTRARAHQAGGLAAPMPGKIFKVIKTVGATVKKGETILILEAMKMEHSIRADKDGVVKKINYSEGELVQGGCVLAELE